jgi:chaperonin GroEL
MGQRCVAHALEAPLRELLANAGIEASPIVARVREAGAPCGFDLRSKQITNLLDAGVVDSAEVVQRALRNAGSLATMAITTAVVVHHRKPNLQVKT